MVDNGALIRPYFFLGKGSNLTTIFANGLVKPPTSQSPLLTYQSLQIYRSAFFSVKFWSVLALELRYKWDLTCVTKKMAWDWGIVPSLKSTSGQGDFKEIPAILAGWILHPDHSLGMVYLFIWPHGLLLFHGNMVAQYAQSPWEFLRVFQGNPPFLWRFTFQQSSMKRGLVSTLQGQGREETQQFSPLSCI